MRQATVLALLASVLAASLMVAVQAKNGVDRSSAFPMLVDALGAPKPDAPLARRPAEGVQVSIDRKGFRVARRKTIVSLRGLGTGSARWARFSSGASRRTSFGRETIVVTPEKAEQFLTVDRRQGAKTWLWRLGADGVVPRVGADGAVGLLAGGRVLGMHIEPVGILDAGGRDVTPKGLRWSLAQDRLGWLLELRLDDRSLALPYVIDPSITYRSALTSNNGAAGATSIDLDVPGAVAADDLLFAHISARGGSNMSIATPAGWTLLRDANNGTTTRLTTFYRVASSSEPAFYTFTFGGGTPTQQAVGAITAYYGLKTSAPLDINGATSTGTGTTVTANAVTTVAANTLVIAAFSHGAGFNLTTSPMFTTVTGMTERYDAQSANATAANRAGLAGDTMGRTTAGTTSNRSTTASVSAAWVAHQVAFKADDVFPTATQNDPGAVLRGTVTFSGDASDADSGVRQVQFQACASPCGGGWSSFGAPDTTSPYSIVYDTTGTDGLYDIRAVATDFAGNVTNSTPVTTLVDNTAPSSDISVVEGTRPDLQYFNTATDTYYYNPAAAGDFSLQDAAADTGGSGVASVDFPAIALTGFGGAAATDTAAPYDSDVYSFDPANVAAPSGYSVAVSDVAGNQTNDAVAFVRDTTAPTGYSVSLVGGPYYSTSESVPLALANGTDAGAAVDTSSGIVERDSAPYSGTCGSFSGTWTQVTLIGGADTSVLADNCYRYRYSVADNVGNRAAFSAPSADAIVVPGISLRGAVGSNNGGTGTSSLVLNMPSGVAANDLLVAQVTVRGGTGVTITAPGGWTFIRRENATTNLSQAVYYRVAPASPPASYTWSFSSAQRATGGIVSYTGVDNSAPIDISSGAANTSGSSSAVQAPAVITTVANTMIVGFFGIRSASTFTPPAGMTERWDTNAGTSPTSEAADVLQTAAGSSGAKTANATAAAVWVGQLVALRPDTVPPTAPVQSISESNLESHASGSTFFYRPAGAGGSFTVTTSTGDNESGVQKVAFPGLGGGFTPTGPLDVLYPGAYARTYTWPGGSGTESGVKTVTVRDNARNSSTGTFEVTPDSSVPTSSAVCAPPSGCSGWTTTSPVTLTLSTDDGAGSGIRFVKYTTDGSDPTAVNGLVYTVPLSLSSTTTVKFRAWDNVDNLEAVQTQVVQIDTSAPLPPTLSFGSLSNAVVNGGVVWYRPSAASGQFAVTASATDAESGIASYSFPAAATGWTRSVFGATATYSHTGAPSDPAEPNDVSAQNNAGLTSAPTSFAVDPDGTAPVTSIQCNGGLCSAPWYSPPVSVSLSAGDGDSGVSEIRYTTDGSDPSPVNGAVYSSPFDLVATATVRFRSYDQVGNEEPVASQLIQVDTTDPLLTVAAASQTGSTSWNGTDTVYYRPGGSGSFDLTATLVDPESGPQEVSFPAIAGFGAGDDDASAPYSSSYSYSGTPAEPGTQTVTGYNNVNLISTASVSITADGSAPSGQTISTSGGPWFTALSVPYSTGDGTDTGSGVDTASRLVERASATLADGTCGSFGSFSPAPASPDTTVVSGNCYRYRFTVADRVGNVSAPVTVDALIDTSAPGAPSLAYGSFANAALTSGVVYYRPSAAGGQFAVTASATDPESGIASYSFPAAAAGWTPSIAGATATYSHTGAPSDPAEPNDVSAQNNAGLASGPASFTVTPDASAPVGQSVALSGGPYYTTLSVGLDPGDGTDTGSGLDLGSRVYERDEGTLADDTCTGFPGTYSATVSNPDTSVVSGRCYRYRLKISDRVGNESSPSPPSAEAKVDTSAPAAPVLVVSESPADPDQHVVGQVVYYRPGTNGGSFTVTATASDSESGILHVSFPAVATVTGGGNDAVAPYDSLYSWNVLTTADTATSATATNSAGTTGAPAGFEVHPDSAAPASSIQCNSGVCSGGWYVTTVSISLSANDAASGVDEIRYTTDGSDPSPVNGTVYSAAFDVSSTITVRYRAYDRLGNEEAVGQKLIQIDTVAPATTAAAANASGSVYWNGADTVFYRPGGAGSFDLTATVDDGQSGPQKANFPAIAGFGAGGDDTSAPYSSAYSYSGTPAEPGAKLVTGYDTANLTSTATVNVTADSTGPTGHSATIAGGYYTSLSVAVTLDNGSDTGTGIDAASGVVERDEETLTADSCPAFDGTWSSVTLSGGADTSVLSGKCYRYRYKLTDRVGNQSTSGPSATAKVDTSAPAAPVLSFGSLANAVVSGGVLWYRPSAAGGQFAVTASAGDTESGIAGYNFPAAATGWSRSVVGPTATYSHSGSPSDPAEPNDVTASNNAGLTSAPTSFTVSPDSTGPTGQSATVTGGYYTSLSVPVTLANGSDGESGLETASGAVERESVALAAGICGSFSGSWSSVTLVGGADTTVQSGNCYRYRYTISDRVGNASSPSAASATAKIDTGQPSVTQNDPGANIRATVPLTASASDPVSGIASVTIQRSPAGAGTWTAIGTDNSAPFSVDFVTTAVTDGLYDFRAIATDGAGNVANSSVVANRRVDNTLPTAIMDNPGGSLNDIETLTGQSTDGGSGTDTVTFQYSASGSGTWTTIGTDSTSPYSINWDTWTVPDGRYDLRVIAVDVAGNSRTSAPVTNRQVQNLPPFASITAPGDFVNAADPSPYTITAAASALSPKTVAQVEFFRCNNTSGNCATGTYVSLGVDTTAPYSAQWTQALEAEGNRALRVEVTDSSFSTGGDILNVTIDRTPPSSQTISLNGGPWFTATSVAFTTGDGSDGGSGLSPASRAVERAEATVTNGACDTYGSFGGSFVSPDTSVASGNCYRYRFSIADNAGNRSNWVETADARIDTSAPTTPGLTVLESPADPDQHVSGSTLFYRPGGGRAGSFSVGATTSDAQSGIQRVSFPALTGMTGGGDDLAAPFQTVYDWTDTTGTAGSQDVTSQNGAGTSATASFTVTPDSTVPTGQTAALVGGPYYTTASLSFTTGNGSDSGADLDLTSGVVERAEAPLVNGNCDPLGSFSGSYANPDTSVSSGTCYRYRFSIADNVGNRSSWVETATGKVDTSAPTVPALSFGSFANASLTGSTVSYRPSAGSGEFTVTASSNDGQSGVASYSFPAAASGWTVSGSGASRTYSHSGSPADPADPNDVTAQNNAGLASAASSFDVTPDGAGPTGHSATIAGGYYTALSIPVTLDNGSDTGSGVDAASGIVERDEETLSGDSCPAFDGSWSTVTLSGGADTSVQSGKCYRYRYTISDRVGNQATQVGTSATGKVDSSAPGAPTLSYGSFSNAALAGGVVYYRPGAASGQFDVTASTGDAESGIASYAFSAPAAGWWISGTGASRTYSHTGSPIDPADPNDVTATNNAGLSSAPSSFIVTPDASGPTGHSATIAGGYYTALSIPVTLDNGSDTGSGVDAASGIVERDEETLSADSCPAFDGAWSTVTLSGGADTTVESGKCYRYRYTLSDRVGNQATQVGTSATGKVDSSAPSTPTFSYSGFTNAAVAGGIVYFRPSVAGAFTVTASSSDGETGVAGYAFPTLGSGWSGTQAGASYDYSFGSSAADPAEPLNVTATNNVGLTSNPGSFTVAPDASAPTSSIQCDGAACLAGWHASSVWISLSANDGAGSGVQEIRYTTDGSDPSPVNGTVYSIPFSLGATTTVKFHSYDGVGNEEGVASQLVRIDITPASAPALTLSESPASAKQHVSGTTLYYNPQSGNSGGFTVDATTDDAQSGISKVSFPSLTGMTGGGDDPSNPYQGAYSWTASSSASGPQSVDSVNNSGLSTTSSFTATPDTAPPSTGFASYPGGYASGSVTIATDDGTDPLSGVNASTGVLERDETNLVDGSCDPFTGPWSAISSPDSTITSGHCYRYRYRVSDNVGNEAAYTSGNVVKVSTGAPSAPDLVLAETPDTPNQHVSGTTLFYSPTGGNTGDFTITATVSDSGGSGVDKVSFPSLTGMPGGGDDAASPYEGVYDWDATSSAAGMHTVTVQNNAGLTSQGSFTLTSDTAPPTGQDASVTGGYYTSLSVPVNLQDGSDALSGVDSASGIVERESGTLTSGNCGAWGGGWSPVTLSGGADTTVLSNRCYRYRYLVSDNVGNQTVASSSSLDAKIDATTPVTSDDAPASWVNAPVTVTLSVDETGSGTASTVYRVDGGSFQSGTSFSIAAPADHSNDGAHTIEYRSTDAAGNVEALRSATVGIDTTVPATTDDAPTGWRSSAVTVTLTAVDALSAIASTQYRIDGGLFQNGTSVVVAAPADHSNDGVHTIEYRSTDNAGNVEPLQTATVQIDTELPSGALTAPADGAQVNGNVAISASANDLPSGVSSVEFLVRPNGDPSFTTISTDTTAPYNADWDSSGAPEGNAELGVVVVDNAGLSFTSALRTIIVDNAPAPTLDNPAANLAGTVTLTAVSQPDTAQVVFERSPAGAGTWTQIATDATAPFSADFDTTSVADGDYELRAVATDLGGFNGTSPLRTARVDNTAPTVSVSDPASGAVVGGPNVHLAALASDSGSGVGSVRFEQRPAGSGAFTTIGTDTSDPYEASWDATGLSGSYELRAAATDAAGNPATAATVTVTIAGTVPLDTTAPSVTLANPGGLLRDVVSLAATAPNPAIASVAFDRRPVGGGTWTRIALDTSRPWSASFDTKAIGDGLYDLRAQALDGTSQVLATHSLEGIRVDNTAPRVESSTPAEGAVVRSAASIILAASEPVAAVQGTSLDGSAATPVISGANVTFSTRPLRAGAHTLTGTLVDAAGNAGGFALHFTIRAQAKPAFVLQVGKPKTQSHRKQRVFLAPLRLSAPARVQATLLSPSGRKLRGIRVNGSAGRHSLRFALPADSLPPGRYTIVVVATAGDGSRITKRVFVSIPTIRAHKPAAEQQPTKMAPISADPTPSPPVQADDAPAPAPKAQTSEPKPAPKAQTSERKPKPDVQRADSKPLETAGSYVKSKPGRSIGLGLLLLVLGAAFAFLIRIEIGRLLSSTGRLGS